MLQLHPSQRTCCEDLFAPFCSTDLKSKNILVTEDGVAKIADVGMSRMMHAGVGDHGGPQQDGALGTFAWVRRWFLHRLLGRTLVTWASWHDCETRMLPRLILRSHAASWV